MDDLPDPSRRLFLTGGLKARSGAPRPEPASGRDPGGTPLADAAPGTCPGADPDEGPLAAMIGTRCLPLRGVDCQLCRDACPGEAIGFRPRRGGPFTPHVRLANCTGCGDCLPVCPTAAIALWPAAGRADV